MKARITLVLAMILVLVVASTASVAAKGAVVPFKGEYVTHPVATPIQDTECFAQVITAEGQATHLGKSTWYSEATVCRGTPPVQSGFIDFTAANGDHLIMDFTGTVAYAPDFSTVNFSGDYEIVSGAGRFAGASGAGTYWGTATLTLPDNIGEIRFDGTLIK